MKNSEIRELTDKELNARIKEEKTSLTKLKFTHAVTTLENPTTIGRNKKTIARLLTEQKRRQSAKA